MSKITRMLGVVCLSVMVISFSNAWAEKFSCKDTEKTIELRSGNANVTINSEANQRNIFYFNGYLYSFFCTIGDKGYYFSGYKKAELVVDNPEKKLVHVSMSNSSVNSAYQLNVDLEAQKGIPAIFVKYEIKNLSDVPISKMRTMWSIKGFNASGDTYALPDLKEHNFVWEWKGIPKRDWLYLHNKSKKTGSCLITSLNRIAQNSNNYMRYCTCYSNLNKPIQKGESFEGWFIVFPANSPKEAKSIYEKIGEQRITDWEYREMYSPEDENSSLVKKEEKTKERESSLTRDALFPDSDWIKFGDKNTASGLTFSEQGARPLRVKDNG